MRLAHYFKQQKQENAKILLFRCKLQLVHFCFLLFPIILSLSFSKVVFLHFEEEVYCCFSINHTLCKSSYQIKNKLSLKCIFDPQTNVKLQWEGYKCLCLQLYTCKRINSVWNVHPRIRPEDDSITWIYDYSASFLATKQILWNVHLKIFKI